MTLILRDQIYGALGSGGGKGSIWIIVVSLYQETRGSQPSLRFINFLGGSLLIFMSITTSLWFSGSNFYKLALNCDNCFHISTQFSSANESGKNNYFITFNEGISGYFKLKIMNLMTPFAGFISQEWTHSLLVFVEINLNHSKRFPVKQFLIVRVKKTVKWWMNGNLLSSYYVLGTMWDAFTNSSLMEFS